MIEKIAVCLFGLSPFDDRKLAVSFPYDQFVGDRYHIDGKNYSSLKSWEDNVLRENVDVYMHNWVNKDSNRDKLVEIFNPKSYFFENIRSFLDDRITHLPNNISDDYNRQRSCAYSMKKSVELMNKSGNEYDLVLLVRIDVIWYKKIDFNIFNKDKFTCSYWGKRYEDLNYSWNKFYDNSNRYGTHDIYFAGSPNNINTFVNMYDNFHELVEEIGFYANKACGFGSGHLIKRLHMEKTKLIDIIDHKLVVGKDADIEVEYNSGIPQGW